MKAIIDGVLVDLPDFDHPAVAAIVAPTMSAGAFFDRFTATETVAVWTAAKSTDPALTPIGVGLMQGLANGTIDLTSPLTIAWVNGLAAAGILTPARAAAVLTP